MGEERDDRGRPLSCWPSRHWIGYTLTMVSPLEVEGIRDAVRMDLLVAR